MREQNSLSKYPLCLVEPELAADPVTGQYIHLSGEIGHAFPHAGADQGHISQGIRAHSLK